MSAGSCLKASEVCFVSEGAIHHKHVQPGIQEMEGLCFSNLKTSFLPANPIHVALYLQFVLESTRSCSSVDTAFYAIKWAHEIAGMAIIYIYIYIYIYINVKI